MTSRDQLADRHAIEARLAARLAGSLTVQAQRLPHDVIERLRFAREGALTRAREARMATAPTIVGISGAGAALLSGLAAPWWRRAASMLPLLLLVFGLVFIDRFAVRERVMAAAEIDAQLLADKLPPSAYSDPGFAEYLKTVPPL
ncbi:MAG: DUF3619 domain-containing protein [Leptothrix sp. (in: Bacteria)]|nr:DUF3619 domain-containing protein [Leptothrix sp. (in: b-proteobacteria)]